MIVIGHRSARQSGSPVSEAGLGMIRITLLFGSLAVAIAMFLTPLLDRGGSSDITASVVYGGLDRTAAGAIRNNARQYTIRRSVLQNDPGSMCIIHTNGRRTGDC